ncbi:MAG: FAD-binding oxidoreductase [Aeromicrobium sp.]
MTVEMPNGPRGGLREAVVHEFRATFRGDIIGPGDPGYETARMVHNGMIDRYPRLIARCGDVADVMTAVRFARTNGVTVAVRSGGHSAPGFGTLDDGLVIDLSPMDGITVDPVAQTVRVETGSRWGDVDHATHAFGMATPNGIVSTTGVGGLTLGGGVGHLARRYGLTIDSLLAADLVLADGTAVTASAERNSDLFWAIRGGGGNFGIATSFLFRLHPVSSVYAGPMMWPLERATDVMRWYRDFLPSAPEDLSGFFAFLNVPPGPPFPEHLWATTAVAIVWCYTGPLESVDAIFAPIRSALGVPLVDLVGVMPFPALQSMFDPLLPAGIQSYWRADFVNELTDEAIALHVEHGSALPTLMSTMHIYPMDGAVRRVGRNDTAFSYRNTGWLETIVGFDMDPANAGLIRDWAVAYWDALHPFAEAGAYVNFMMAEGEERVRATYRDNYNRLAEIKTRFDPTNFFRLNQNIKPAV